MKHLFGLAFTILFTLNAYSGELLIASYNAHNLFDTEHDEGKDDWTFIAQGTPGKTEACNEVSNSYYRQKCLDTDWNEKKLRRKLHSLKRMLTRGFERLPDIVALQEVENESIVRRLGNETGYDQVFATNSPDRRGIDVALMVRSGSNLNVINTVEHTIQGEFLVKPTRNILEVVFSLGGEKTLSVFVNHWPSQAAPAAVRVGVAEILKSVITERLSNPNNHVVVTGDFNTIAKDHPHPFKDVIEKGEKGLINVHESFKRNRDIDVSIKKQMPLGTYFYARNMEWNVLDNFFVSKNLNDESGVEADLTSFRIVAPRFAKTRYRYDDRENIHFGTVIRGVPKNYDHEVSSRLRDAGYSDHFPVVLKINY